MRQGAVIGLVVLAILGGCRRGTPEQRIAAAFGRCVQAVEAGDPGGVLEVLSPAFSGPEGMDRGAAQLFLAGVLRREKVGVTVISQRLELDGQRALQQVDVLLTGRSGGELLPRDGSRRSFLIRWELRDGQWRIREVQETAG